MTPITDAPNVHACAQPNMLQRRERLDFAFVVNVFGTVSHNLTSANHHPPRHRCQERIIIQESTSRIKESPIGARPSRVQQHISAHHAITPTTRNASLLHDAFSNNPGAPGMYRYSLCQITRMLIAFVLLLALSVHAADENEGDDSRSGARDTAGEGGGLRIAD